MTLCGFMAGAAGFEDIEDDGESKLDLLGELLPLARGVPSDDTRRFFRAVEPQAFAAAFGICARSVAGGGAAPDGGGRQDPAPQLRRHGQGPASGECVCPEARRVLAPTARAEKSNEISAIPELLRLLDLRGATVSMDASGCQREMAAQMVEGGADIICWAAKAIRAGDTRMSVCSSNTRPQEPVWPRTKTPIKAMAVAKPL